ERQVAEPVKDARLAELQALLKIQQDEFNAAALGRTVPVLYERAGRNPGQLVGKTPWLHVDLSASSCTGGLGAVGTDLTGFGVAWAMALLQGWTGIGLAMNTGGAENSPASGRK
ncbi:MAG: hypothetical protein Q8J75_04760, partial [Rhodocyclaceae bacterium]|nr:hypothetical protein [Rhodocyclaceae bacterium]